jgi:hypothetical protein
MPVLSRLGLDGSLYFLTGVSQGLDPDSAYHASYVADL